jgi:hypothetical protein
LPVPRAGHMYARVADAETSQPTDADAPGPGAPPPKPPSLTQRFQARALGILRAPAFSFAAFISTRVGMDAIILFPPLIAALWAQGSGSGLANNFIMAAGAGMALCAHLWGAVFGAQALRKPPEVPNIEELISGDEHLPCFRSDVEAVYERVAATMSARNLKKFKERFEQCLEIVDEPSFLGKLSNPSIFHQHATFLGMMAAGLMYAIAGILEGSPAQTSFGVSVCAASALKPSWPEHGFGAHHRSPTLRMSKNAISARTFDFAMGLLAIKGGLYGDLHLIAAASLGVVGNRFLAKAGGAHSRHPAEAGAKHLDELAFRIRQELHLEACTTPASRFSILRLLAHFRKRGADVHISQPPATSAPAETLEAE